MQLTMTTDYAIRTMLFLYSKREQSTVSMEEIAHTMKIPVTYMSKITKILRDANMIETLVGVNGGSRILDMSGKVSLYDIIQASEPEKINRCLEDDHLCSRDGYGSCAVCRFYGIMQEVWDHALKRMTIAFLASDPDTAEIRRALGKEMSEAQLHRKLVCQTRNIEPMEESEVG